MPPDNGVFVSGSIDSFSSLQDTNEKLIESKMIGNIDKESVFLRKKCNLAKTLRTQSKDKYINYPLHTSAS